MSSASEIVLPSHEHLENLGIPYEKKGFPSTTDKGAQNVAQVLGLTERQAVKTLIFDTNKEEYVLVMLGGDQNAVSSLLKKALGSRNIKLADPQIVKEITGYQIGSIPPFHWQPPGFRTIIEESLLEESLLGVGAGVWGNEIMITPENLIRACGALAVNLTIKGNAE